MTHTKANKSKILMLVLGLSMCLALMLGIVFASPTFAAYAAGEDGTAPTIIRTGGIDVDRENHMGTLPNALKGVEYKAKDGSNYKIEATGTEPFTFRANKSGEGYAPLPEGLSLNPTTGEIVGTPTGDAGKYNISVTVTNKYGSDNISVGMYVYGETSKPKITTTQADIAVGYVDSSYSQRIVYNSGIGEPSKASITNGNLPTGLILRQAGFGIYIEGKPTEEGTFTFTVRLQNAAGFDEETYTITIQKGYQRPKIINQDDITNKPAIKGKYFEFQFEATGTNAADNPFLFFTYLNQFEESTPNAQDEYELGNGLFLTKEGKVYGTPYSTEDISFNVGVKTKNLNGDYEETGFGTGNCYVPVYENGQITGVTISPENTSVPKGGQRQFTATVIGYGDFDKSVTWDIYDYSAGTTISQDGVLTVGIDETATTIRVEARSKGDTNILKEIPVTIINHTHTTTLVPATPKTCTTDGNIEHYKCNVCGDLFADAGAVNQLTEGQVKIPAGHEYGDLVPKQEPTCTQTGMQAHYKCSVCNKYFDESKTEKTVEELTIPIDPNAHDFGAWIAEVPATCKDTGVKAHKDCNRCNRHYDESGNEITDLTIPTNDNHDWNAWVSNGDGTHTRTCKRDSDHKETGTCSGGKATCTSKAVCDVCRTTYGDTAPHTYGDLIPEVPATTEDFGVKEHKDCKVCGKHFDKDGNEITELRIAKIGTHNVVINGESNFYAHGESVTVTAEDKEGKEFVGWKDASGKIVSTKKEYTFEVKDEMVLTAVYQDKAPGGGTIDGEIAPAPDKKGLSGGQIAGIVIGSIAGVGIVGFAIFWFVVKKKTFAELISAIKALFNKKQ
ncbi:MAG: putative Ig domain-containing protein [Christensenellales bacterium]|nr:putative Ig domain-containing protein [Christensenellales bacterium]